MTAGLEFFSGHYEGLCAMAQAFTPVKTDEAGIPVKSRFQKVIQLDFG